MQEERYRQRWRGNQKFISWVPHNSCKNEIGESQADFVMWVDFKIGISILPFIRSICDLLFKNNNQRRREIQTLWYGSFS